MGYTSAHAIRDGARYLLGVLRKAGGSVKYGAVFYDGTEETEKKLREGLGEPSYDDHAESLIDYAAYQLQEFGLVTITDLDRELPDGERDYEIALTEKGASDPLDFEALPFYTTE